MTESSRQRARRVFMEIADLACEERARALARACGDDAALRAEVEALLAADEGAAGFMASPTGQAPSSVADARTIAGPAREHEGQMLGRYKLLQPIGEGGFGSVWMAEQREPVKRRVALKVIKLGMDTKQVIARFEAERQALAMMDHPNIAKVLDAGATETGRPYFVMEYIKGVPLLEYCDTERLDTRARLDLFTSVCHAIQHAHQKGIIHRDIKSSNVLVTMHDGVPVPKVIDFGIAKATSAELTQRTLFTEHRQMIGTPAYMSPEQAEMSGLDIDTRSDIYSLGVLLYELLTGTTPFATEDLLSKGFAEMMRIIREVEPHKPSTRLSSLGDTAPRTAQQRKAADTARLSAQIRGDLDWIVMKCLEKDRTRRYETASGLAADIRRHLSDEPVSAGPPSASYKLHKFVRRNRGKVVAGSIVAAALVLGVVGTSAGMVWALNERTRANDAAERERLARLAAQENETKAVAEATRSQRISEFVKAALEAGDAYHEGGGQTTTVLDAMNKALREIDSGRFKDDPETEAMLQCTIAGVLTNNGRIDEGESLQRRALATLRELHKSDDLNLAAGINGLARILAYRDKPAEAEPLFRESATMLERIHPEDNAHIATAYNNLGYSLMGQGRLAESEEWFKKAIALDERLAGGGDSQSLAMALDNLSKAAAGQKRLDEAEQLAVRALAMRERMFKGDHPDLAIGLGTLAEICRKLGDRERCDELFRRSLEMTRRLFKGDTEYLGSALLSYGDSRRDMGRLDDADTQYKEAISIFERLEGPTGENTLLARIRLGELCIWAERYEEAAVLYKSALDLAEARQDVPAGTQATLLDGFARVRFHLGRTDEGLELAKQALAARRSTFSGDHFELFGSLQVVGGMLSAAGKPEEAEPYLREMVAMGGRLFDEQQPLLLDARDALAVNHWRMGKIDLAITEFESVFAIRSRALGPNHPETLATQANLGVNYKDAGRFPEAIKALSHVCARLRVTPLPRMDFARPALLEAYSFGADPANEEHRKDAILLVKELMPGIRAELPMGSAELARALAQCALPLLGVRAYEDAEPLARESLRIRASLEPLEWTTFNTRSMLGGALLGLKKYDEAAPLLTAGYEGLKAREAGMPQGAKIRIAEALDRLITLAAETGKPEDEARWRAERAKYTP